MIRRPAVLILAVGCLWGCEPTGPAVPIPLNESRRPVPNPEQPKSEAAKTSNPFPPGTPYGDDPNAATDKSLLMQPRDTSLGQGPQRLYPGAPDTTPGTGYANNGGGSNMPSTTPYGSPMPGGGTSVPGGTGVPGGGGPSPGSSPSDVPSGGSNPYGGNPYGG